MKPTFIRKGRRGLTIRTLRYCCVENLIRIKRSDPRCTLLGFLAPRVPGLAQNLPRLVTRVWHVALLLPLPFSLRLFCGWIRPVSAYDPDFPSLHRLAI